MLWPAAINLDNSSSANYSRAMSGKIVVVVGGGAAGLMAALAASEHGAQVILLEKNPRVGKKLLATGNGRCNYTNEDLKLAHFHGSDPNFIRTILSRFSGAQTLQYFYQLGVEPVTEEAGKVFPASGQASSILDVLRHQAEYQGVALVSNTTAKRVDKNGSSFTVYTSVGSFIAEAVILATGGKAGPQFGCSGDGYALAARWGHKLIEPFPALVQLRLKAPFLKAAAGVKVQGRAEVYHEADRPSQAEGELLFTNYGISGPPILAVSRAASEALSRGHQPALKLNLLPRQQPDEVASYLQDRFRRLSHKTAELSLVGFINKRLIIILLKEAGIELKLPAGKISLAQIKRLAALLTSWVFTVVGTNGWTAAQVTAGGLDHRQICPRTLQSKLVPGLYFAGELIDVDGDCGGYNLQWAWSSGYTAGVFAAL